MESFSQYSSTYIFVYVSVCPGAGELGRGMGIGTNRWGERERSAVQCGGARERERDQLRTVCSESNNGKRLGKKEGPGSYPLEKEKTNEERRKGGRFCSENTGNERKDN